MKIVRLGIFLRLLSYALLSFPLLSSLSLASTRTTTIYLGTATKGGGFELFGNTLVSEINKRATTFRLEAQATRGSKQNLKLLADGSIDLGLVEGNAARQAIEGIGREKLNLKVLSVMYPNPGMFVVRADSPYYKIEDLRGKPVVFGTQASGLRILVQDVLTGLGFHPDKDFEPITRTRPASEPKFHQ